MALNNISFEKIDDKYSYGHYGDFNVVIMNSNSYINVTKLCNDVINKNGGNKRFRTWKENSGTNEFMKMVASNIGIPISELLITISGHYKSNAIIRGTYAHPDLIPQIASWASPQFAHRVSQIVNKYFIKQAIKEKEKIIKKKDDKIDKLMDKIDKQTSTIDKQTSTIDKMDKRIKRLLDQNDDLYDQNEEVLHKLDKISRNRVILTGRSSYNEILVIIKNNDDPEEYDSIPYAYHVLRIMKQSYNNTLLKHYNRHPDMKIILKIKFTPNAANLWHQIINKLGSKGNEKIIIKGCKFNLSDGYKESDLADDVKQIHNERLNHNKI